MKNGKIRSISAVLPLFVLPLVAWSAVEPREQVLEIINRCAHKVDVRAKQRFFRRPWKEVPSRFVLEPDEVLKTREWRWVRLFWLNDEMARPPRLSFQYEKKEIPFETVAGSVPDNKKWKCEMYRVVACPERMRAEDGHWAAGTGAGGCGGYRSRGGI